MSKCAFLHFRLFEAIVLFVSVCVCVLVCVLVCEGVLITRLSPFLFLRVGNSRQVDCCNVKLSVSNEGFIIFVINR